MVCISVTEGSLHHNDTNEEAEGGFRECSALALSRYVSGAMGCLVNIYSLVFMGRPDLCGVSLERVGVVFLAASLVPETCVV